MLAGAVAKGAFEAGALAELVAADVEIVRIVGASAGALSGVALATGVAGRRAKGAIDELVERWRDDATWRNVFHPSLGDIVLRRDGFSDQQKLLAMLRDGARPVTIADPAQVDLRLVVASLAGVEGDLAGQPATTHEKVLEFSTADLVTAERLEAVFAAAVASASLPLVFAPVTLPGIGRCVDGGAVNNTPIKWAIDRGRDTSIDAVVVVSTTPEHAAPPAPEHELHLVELVGRLAEMLIDERLYRDLREAESVNAELAALERLAPDVLDAQQLARVKQALGWQQARVVPIVAIRPPGELPGNAFAGFVDGALRRAYLDAGRAAAAPVVRAQGWI